jgi:Tol biopolymer transport system component
LPDIDSGYVALAPDERRIAYVVSPHDPDELNTGNLVVRSLDGDQSVVRLTRARGTPAWSPDGKSLAAERWSEAAAYGAAGGSPPQVAVVPVTGGAGTPRTASPGGQARWLPDGRLLVPDADSGTLVVTRVGDTQGRVVVTGVHVGDVPWDVTPDGTTLVVAGQGDVNYDLTLVDLKSSRSRVLPSEPATDVRWSADNTRLAVVAGERILLVDPSRTAAPRVLTRIPGRVLTGLAWSPDGRSLAVTASVPSHED